MYPWLRRSLVNRIIDRARSHHDELDIEAVQAEWRDDSSTVMPERVLERAELRDELESCPTCPPLYASLVGVRDTLGSLRDPDSVVEDKIAGRIRGRLSLERAAGWPAGPAETGGQPVSAGSSRRPISR